MSTTEAMRHAERSMNVFWDHYEAGDMERPLQVVRSLGYSALSMDFVFNPDNYYFPNQRNGQLIRPKSVDDSKIPIISRKPDQVVNRPQPHIVHPLQRIALAKLNYSDSIVDQVDAFLSESHPIPISSSKRSEASVHLPLVGNIKSSPALVLNRWSPKRKCPSVIMHELVHVVQALDSPITDYDDMTRVNDELEAYGAQAELHRVGVMPRSPSMEMARRIDETHWKHLGQITSILLQD